MPDERDPLDTLRALADWNGQTVGATARDLADAAGEDLDAADRAALLTEVQLDLDRYRADGLVSLSRNPINSLFYGVTEQGFLALRDADGTPVPVEAFDFPEEDE